MMKKALITGVTGQDGSYLTAFVNYLNLLRTYKKSLFC